jgi:hypothetical protein
MLLSVPEASTSRRWRARAVEDQMLGIDRAPAAKQQRTLDDVLELADIARPVVIAQRLERGVRDPRHRAAAAGVTHDHRGGERGDVALALDQRLGHQREDRQAVVKIGAEAAGGDFGLEIAVGAGDDADVDLFRHRAADRHHFALLEDAEQLGLEAERHLGDLVEQDGAAMRGAEKALAARGGAGEGALLVAEQHRLEHRLGQRGAVDRHERAVACGSSHCG